MGLTEKNFALSSSKNTPEGSNRTPDLDFSLKRGSARKFSSVTSGSASELSSRDDLREVSLAVADGGAVDYLKVPNGSGLSREQREQIRCSQVGRKKDFVFIERINGKPVNVLQGLELHTQVFSAAEQRRILAYVYSLQRMGQNGQLRGSCTAAIYNLLQLLVPYMLSPGFSSLTDWKLFSCAIYRVHLFGTKKVDARKRTCDYSIRLLLQLCSGQKWKPSRHYSRPYPFISALLIWLQEFQLKPSKK